MKESWRQKLHLAKLAAWMKAKAQIEASDLASSLVPLMLPAVKNIDDYSYSFDWNINKDAKFEISDPNGL